MRHFTTLIDANTLSEHLSREDLTLFDCRFDLGNAHGVRRSIAAAHLPGALYLHLDRDLSGPVTASSGRHPLPDPERFAARLAELGVSHGLPDRRLRPGKRRVRGAAVVAGALDRLAQCRGARRRHRRLARGGPAARNRGAHTATARADRCRSRRTPGSAARPSMNCGSVRATCSSTRAARSDLRDETKPSTRWPATCPAPETVHFSTISAPTDDSCPPRCCGSASARCSGSVAPVVADRHVRLGRHRLPQSARARTRRTHRRASLCRLLERVDPRSATAGRHGCATKERISGVYLQTLFAIVRANVAAEPNPPPRAKRSRAAPNDPSPGRSTTPPSSTRSTPGARAISA